MEKMPLLSSEIDSSNISSKIKSNKLSNYLFYIAFSVTTLIGLEQKAVANEQAQDQTQEINQLSDSEKRISNSKEIINLLLNFLSNEKLNLSKENLNNIYRTYINTGLGENTELYLRNLILKSYVEMLKTGYTVNGYQELDELIEKINILSNGSIRIVYGENMPNPEFNEIILVVGNLSEEGVIEINKNTRISFNRILKDKTTININSEQLLNIFLSDLPDSLKIASGRITNLSQLNTNLSRDLLIVKQEISSLLYRINQLNNKINLDEQKYKDELERIQKEKEDQIKKEKEDFEKFKQELENKHKLEIEKLEEEKGNKISENEALKKSHETQIERLISEHQVSLRRYEANANQRISRLQNTYIEEKEKADKKIIELEDEIKRLTQLNKDTTDNLNQIIIGLNDDLSSYSENNSDLNNEISTLNSRIEQNLETIRSLQDNLEVKDEEISDLIDEKTTLTSQINTVGNAKDLLLSQTQQNLRSANDLNYKLNVRIRDLESQVLTLQTSNQRLEQANERLTEFERISSQLEIETNNRARIQNQNIELEIIKKELEEKLKELIAENQGLKLFEEKANKYNETLDQLETEKQENKDNVEKIQNLISQINSLNTSKNTIEKSLETQRSNNRILQDQLEQFQKSFEEIIKGNASISGDLLAEELRKQIEEYTKLRSDYQELLERQSEIENENNELKTQMLQKDADQAAELIKIREEFAKKFSRFTINQMRNN